MAFHRLPCHAPGILKSDSPCHDSLGVLIRIACISTRVVVRPLHYASLCRSQSRHGRILSQGHNVCDSASGPPCWVTHFLQQDEPPLIQHFLELVRLALSIRCLLDRGHSTVPMPLLLQHQPLLLLSRATPAARIIDAPIPALYFLSAIISCHGRDKHICRISSTWLRRGLFRCIA